MKVSNFIVRVLLSMAAMAVTMTAGAGSFTVDGIHYTTSGSNASVTYSVNVGQPHKTLTVANIPPQVTYNNNTYTVTSIGFGAFYLCKALETLTLPETLTTIGNNAFYGCSSLKHVDLPQSLRSIAMWGFRDSGLTEIFIPKNLTSLGSDVFTRCPLDHITVEAGNSTYDSRDNCNAIIRTADGVLLKGSNNTVIPYGVTTIGQYAFSLCKKLNISTVPSSVTAIHEYAFDMCDNITTFTIPESVKELRNNVFDYCNNLETVYLPASLTEIKPSSLGDIRLFAYCPKLHTLVVDEANPVYDSRDNCNAIIITATNELIEGIPTSIIPDGVVKIGYDAFSGKTPLKSVNIPSSVEFINEFAFYSNDSLRSITFSEPSALKAIGSMSFAYNKQLEELLFPDGLDSITNYAAQSCPLLKRVVLPSTVKYIGAGCFSYCNEIHAFYSKIKEPTEVVYGGTNGNSIASNVLQNATLYVPKGSADKYRAIADWQVFPNIVEIDYDNLRGDLNHDYEINTADVSLLYGNVLDGTYNTESDVNDDGAVNSGDISILYDIIISNN